MKVYICTHDCYSSQWTHGVYATAEAAMADHAHDRREWKETVLGGLRVWESGSCDLLSLVAIEEFEVRGGG